MHAPLNDALKFINNFSGILSEPSSPFSYPHSGPLLFSSQTRKVRLYILFSALYFPQMYLHSRSNHKMAEGK